MIGAKKSNLNLWIYINVNTKLQSLNNELISALKTERLNT